MRTPRSDPASRAVCGAHLQLAVPTAQAVEAGDIQRPRRRPAAEVGRLRGSAQPQAAVPQADRLQPANLRRVRSHGVRIQEKGRYANLASREGWHRASLLGSMLGMHAGGMCQVLKPSAWPTDRPLLDARAPIANDNLNEGRVMRSAMFLCGRRPCPRLQRSEAAWARTHPRPCAAVPIQQAAVHCQLSQARQPLQLRAVKWRREMLRVRAAPVTVLCANRTAVL